MTNSNLKILLIEDNKALANNIIQFMEERGYVMDYSDNGKSGLSLALNNNYEIIILDLSLPELDGIRVCEEIRQKQSQQTPILMLTARDSLHDKAQGFDAGADDYLTKPFSLEELKMRCQALSKRHLLHKDSAISIGDLVVDSKLQQASRGNQKLELKKIPFQILEILVQKHPQIVSRSKIEQLIWGDSLNDSESLRTHIYTLRQQLDKPFATSMLKTVHGVGYRLEPADE